MDCQYQDLWIGGQGGYHTYRIPALTVTKAGIALAFCEGRVTDAGDGGRKDLLVCRSTDGGQTWSDTAVLYAEPPAMEAEVDLHAATTVEGDVNPRRGDSIGNPTVVVDQRTGRIVVVFIRHVTTVFVSHSDDDGVTWSEPRDITRQACEPGNNIIPGPGAGIQLTHGQHAGRLVIPSYLRPIKVDVPTPRPVSAIFALFSDDGGQTWKAGAHASPGGNECQMVELADGRLMVNQRMQLFGQRLRAVSYSDDGGQSWGPLTHDANLPDPICQASLIQLEGANAGDLLFANPADPADRRLLTVRLSADEGQTWPTQRLVEPGRAGYSAMAQLPDGEVLCLYETGVDNYREKLRLAKFSVEWLSAGD